MVQPRLRLEPCHKTGRLSQAFSWAFSSINRVRAAFKTLFARDSKPASRVAIISFQVSGLNFIAFVEKLNRYQLTHI